MKNRNTWRLVWVAALTLPLAFTGCKKDDPENPADNTFKGNGTFIICEGAFNQGNGRIDFWNKHTDSLKTNIFQAVNDAPLGDVVQSMVYVNDRAYITVNNSGKIEVVDPVDFTSKGTISTGLTSPRYVNVVSSGKAYVSDLFSGSVAILNTSTLAVTGSIAIPGWTEEMLTDNGKTWITNGMKNYTYIVQNDAVTDSVDVGYGSTAIRKDNAGKIWILTGGNYPPNMVPSKLSRVNPATNDVEWSYDFADFGASKLRLSPDKTLLYFLYGGKVYRKNTGDTGNPAEFISVSGKTFYGINVDPDNGNIWLGDAGDFSSAGTVYVYSASGSQIKTFTTGVVPTDFVF